MAVQMTYQQGSCKAHSLYFCTSFLSYSIYYYLFMIIAVIFSIYGYFNQEIMSVKKQSVSQFKSFYCISLKQFFFFFLQLRAAVI